MTSSFVRSQPFSGSTVHIWHLDLDLPQRRLDRCRLLLSADESCRADRFYFEQDRAHFIAARAAMKAILAEYLDCQPQDVLFVYSANGKPELADNINNLALKFNLSHSRGRGLLAMSQDFCVGVDIEFINNAFVDDRTIASFLSPAEHETFLTLRPQDRSSGFFSCWTRKEAYLKALGDGLSRSLGSFDVAFGPGVSPGLLRAGSSPLESSRWSMYDLSVSHDYAAAIVVEGSEHILQQHQWMWPI